MAGRNFSDLLSGGLTSAGEALTDRVLGYGSKMQTNDYSALREKLAAKKAVGKSNVKKVPLIPPIPAGLPPLPPFDATEIKTSEPHHVFDSNLMRAFVCMWGGAMHQVKKLTTVSREAREQRTGDAHRKAWMLQLGTLNPFVSFLRNRLVRSVTYGVAGSDRPCVTVSRRVKSASPLGASRPVLRR